MSTSSHKRTGKGPKGAAETDFDRWLTRAYGEAGAFTVLLLLVRIGDLSVTPVASTFFSIVGDETGWADFAGLLSGSGRPWDGVALFPVLNAGGPLENGAARAQLRALEERVRENRLVINEGEFFDQWGRRLKVEEATSH